MSFLRPLESFIGMFQCLPGVLVSGLVIFFPVVRGGGAVCVCGVFVEFGSSLVRFIWHSFSHPRWPFSRNLQQFRFPSCSVVGVRCARTSGETLSPLRCGRQTEVLEAFSPRRVERAVRVQVSFVGVTHIEQISNSQSGSLVTTSTNPRKSWHPCVCSRLCS